MKVELAGADLRYYWVTSESHPEDKYIVDICAYELGPDDDGIMRYNGKCGGPHGIHGCQHFLIKCEPKLKLPENMGKEFRCKHIKAAEERAIHLIKPIIKRTDPNLATSDEFSH